MDEALAGSLNRVVASTAKDFPELARVYGKDGGKLDWQPGDRLVLKDLGKTLRRIAEQGPDTFYTGIIADQLVATMKAGGGLITKEDLKNYKANVRKPVHGTFRGHDVYGPPRPAPAAPCWSRCSTCSRLSRSRSRAASPPRRST